MSTTTDTAAADYVARNFADAPSEWIVAEITRTAQALADDALVPTSVEWRRDLIAAYADVLASRSARAAK